MNKKLLLFLMLLYCGLLFISCGEISYNGDDRIVFEGYLKRQDGTAIPDVPVYIYVYGGRSDTDNVSYTTTNADGHYRMIFPKPTKFDDISLQINRYQDIYGEETLGITNSSFFHYTIKNILPGDLNSYHIDFGSTALYSEEEVTTLTINFITDGTVNSSNFPKTGYGGLFPNSQLYYNPTNHELEPEEMLYTTTGPTPGELHYYDYLRQPDGITYSRTFNILKNQDFTFKYYNAENEVITVNIPIANEPVTYTVNY
jgi:hypothetical protein